MQNKLSRQNKGAGGFLRHGNFEPGNIDAKPWLYKINFRMGRVVANEGKPSASLTAEAVRAA